MTLASTVFKKSTFQKISYLNALGRNFDLDTSPMLHTKTQGHPASGSGEEDFKGFLSYMGVVAILVM